MMRKCLAIKEDPYIGLLNLRNTPTEELTTSPAQQLMSSRTRTLIPTSTVALQPTAQKSETPELEVKRLKAARFKLDSKIAI